MDNHPEMGRFLYSPDDTGGAGGSANAGAKGSGTSTDNAGASKVFTDEQVNAIVSKRVTETAAKFSEELMKAREEMKAMQAQLDARKIADAEGQQKYEEAKRLREEAYAKELEKERQRAEQAETRYRTTAVTQAITAAAAANNAVDPADVVALLKDAIKFDDRGVMLFSDGTTIEDGVKKFLSSKPHMVRAGGRGGSGASGSGRGTGDTIDPDKPLTEYTPEEIRKLGGRFFIERMKAKQTTPWKQRVQ